MEQKSLDRVAVFSEKWIPPMEGFVKINCDTSIRENIGTGTGAIIRDNSGKALTAAHRLRSEESRWTWRFFACLDGLLLAKDAGYSKVILETDNTTIYFKLKKMDRDFSYLGGIISDILDLRVERKIDVLNELLVLVVQSTVRDQRFERD
ncbi:hypothetical protein DH2020_019875 [Rehmannia glutinosa]|uniref:RNase H type-1 domain-containing protein n=1 Tax=Rehmannia glutinosa TaxID=99300 RepID=A0ABR0WGP5_REHGL